MALFLRGFFVRVRGIGEVKNFGEGPDIVGILWYFFVLLMWSLMAMMVVVVVLSVWGVVVCEDML